MRVRRTVSVWLAVAGLVAAAAPAYAAGQYTSGDPTIQQSLYGVATAFLGGVAFAADGSPLVTECRSSGSPLHRFDAGTLLPTTNGTTTLHPATTIASSAGCGLTNHPDGTLYSNTAAGVTNLDPATGALLRTIGVPGNSLGITVDPRTGNVVYVGADCWWTQTCTIWSTDPVTGTTNAFAVLPGFTESNLVDGIAFDPTGGYLFLSNRSPAFRVTIVDRTGAIVQDVPLPREPDGIAFHVVGSKYVAVNDTAGDVDRLDFPLGSYALPPTLSTMAAGGFRGDLSQVGPDGCLYVTQDGARYDDGTTTGDDSLVRFCPGFAPPPGVGDITGRSIALSLHGVTTLEAGDTGYVSTGTASYVSTSVESVSAGGAVPVDAGVLHGSVTTSVGPKRSFAESSVARLSAGPGGLVQASGIVARSWTDCTGSTGELQIADLTVNGVRVPTRTPGAYVTLPGGGYLIVNEQVTTHPAAGAEEHTVNALHLVLPGVLDLVVGSATSDIHRC